MSQKRILPNSLSGPRSFFTDLDPTDSHYDACTVKRKLKLQMMTKDKVTIAASSLFTRMGHDLFARDIGLTKALESGIIVPALRNIYTDSDHFFSERDMDCTHEVRTYFRESVPHVLAWDINDNSTWFMKTFYAHLTDPGSVLRRHLPLDDAESLDTRATLESMVSNREDKFLTREDVENVFSRKESAVQEYVRNYVTLLYRIFGSKAVLCESHFPQSNMTAIGLTSNDGIISDERVFWDVYVEAVVSFFNSALRLTPDRIDSMKFEDVLKIRESVFDRTFRSEYDKLITMAKGNTEIDDPEQVLLQEEEVTEAAHQLRRQFSERIVWEVRDIESEKKEQVLWVLANVLASFTTGGLSSVISVLSNCLSIPEITSLVSPSLAREINRRVDAVRSFLNSKREWSKRKRQGLLKRYKEFVSYGLPS